MLLVLRVYMIDFYKSPVCCKEGRGNYDTKFEPWPEFYPATIFVYRTIYFSTILFIWFGFSYSYSMFQMVLQINSNVL